MKRPVEENATKHDSNVQKKRKGEENDYLNFPGIAANSADDLRKLSTFDQDQSTVIIIRRLQALRSALKSAGQDGDTLKKAAQQNLLRRCFEVDRHPKVTKRTTLADNLLQYWRLSLHRDDLAYLACVDAIAELLQAMSGDVKLSSSGNEICRSLLDEPNITCFEKGLNQHGRHLASSISCLRLLAEVMTFDGGVCRQHIFKKRHILHANLARFLEPSTSNTNDHASLRATTLAYLIQYIKFQDGRAKLDLLQERHVVKAIFQHIEHDNADKTIQLLTVLEDHVLSDTEIHISDKRRLLDTVLLKGLTDLYTQETTFDAKKPLHDLCTVLHRFFIKYFTLISTEAGRNPLHSEGLDSGRLLGTQTSSIFSPSTSLHDLPASLSSHKEAGVVSLLQSLRPHANQMHRTLLLHIYNLNPDLLTAYFKSSRLFNLEPDITATWMGKFCFLMSLIRVSLRLYDFRPSTDMHMRVTRVTDSIAPLPLNPQVLGHCFNNTSAVVRFLTVKLVITSLQKLRRLLDVSAFSVDGGKQETSLDKDSLLQIKRQVFLRLPEVGTVIGAFHRCIAEHTMEKEGLSQLLALWCVLNPRKAYGGALDISSILSHMSSRPSACSQAAESLRFEDISLQHLLSIAQTTPDMKWWSRFCKFRPPEIFMNSS